MLQDAQRFLFCFILSGVAFVAPESVAAKSKGPALFAKRSHCVVWLKPAMNDGWDSTKTDWAAVRANLLHLGYPDRIATKKLNELPFYRGDAHSQIREAIQDQTWNGVRPLTEGEYIALVKDSSLAVEILKSLPLWSGFQGFDPAAFVAISLQYGNFWRNRYDGTDDFNLWAPLWADHIHGVASATRFLAVTELPVSLPWLLSFFKNSEAAQEEITKAYIQNISVRLKDSEYSDESIIVSAATHLSMSLWPADLVRVVQERVDLKKYPPVTLSSVETCERGYKEAGDCQIMTKAHLDTLGVFPKKYAAPEVWRSTVLIRVNGVLVGAIKREGDPSMLALRNVINANGQLVLMMGATYHLSKDLYALIDAQFVHKPKHRWIGVDLEQLTVHPNSFLLNQASWPSLYKNAILDLMRGKLTAEDLAAREVPYGRPSFQLAKKVRGEILRRIELLRQTLDP